MLLLCLKMIVWSWYLCKISVFFYSSYGPAPANPLLGTSAIMCSSTLNSESSKCMNHPEEKGGVHVDVCSSLSPFMGHSGTYEKIICFHMCPLVCKWKHVCVNVRFPDPELQGCVGRSILCWCKLISRIQTRSALCRNRDVCFCTHLWKKVEWLIAACMPVCKRE